MGKIYVVGIGPGNIEDMTPRAIKILEGADVVVGYKTYTDIIKDFFPGKEFISTGMTGEVERCRIVLEKAREGYEVALVSSGDSGIYGMAGIMLEVVNKSQMAVQIEVIPGITAASAAAAILGAPIVHDFAVISLSDLLTPWTSIARRIEYAAKGDFVICLYNPKSKKRNNYISLARDIIIKYREAATPTGVVRNAGRKDESRVITTLDKMNDCNIDMFTVVIIGNSGTYVENGRIITPRGYNV